MYRINPRVYSRARPFSPQLQVPGWELGLIWGTGMSDVTSSPGAPSPPIRPPVLMQLSEDVITLLTNFAKSG